MATAPAAAGLAAKYGVAAPIINTVCEVLQGNLPARFVLVWPKSSWNTTPAEFVSRGFKSKI